MKDGALLANAGHFDVEVDKKELSRVAEHCGQPRQNIDEYHLKDGRRLYLLAEGRLVNLAAGDGHPAEIMDLSFAVQFFAMNYLREQKQPLPNQVLPLPADLDRRIASLKLAAMGVRIDSLTAEQESYIHSWQLD